MTFTSFHKRRPLVAAVFCLFVTHAYAQAPSGGYSGNPAADMDIRLSQMEDELRTLTGEIESQQHDIAELKAQMDKVNADTQMRLTDLEAKSASGAAAAPATQAQAQNASEAPTALAPAPMYGPQSAAATPQPGTLGTLTTASGMTPEKEYETAYNFMGQNDYASAEAGFKNFLAHYPTHALAPNAAYWLADTYFRRNMLDQAATGFADSYKNYPTSPKAPDSLLDLGLTLGLEGKVQEACLAFDQVNKQFPAASQKIKNAVAQERAHYKCP
jgi:tol-pal system protein YbgF